MDKDATKYSNLLILDVEIVGGRMATKPEVFIIESLKFKDEKKNRLEGEILERTLKLSGKEPQYYYLRTKRELKKVLKRFKKSNYRYLHLSCHGNDESIGTTLNSIEFEELGDILRPYLSGRRLFFSSCEVVNKSLAAAVMPESECNSIIGPTEEVDFDKAAVMWASFYYLAFEENRKKMDRDNIKPILNNIARLFEIPIAYYGKHSDSSDGYRLENFPRESES